MTGRTWRKTLAVALCAKMTAYAVGCSSRKDDAGSGGGGGTSAYGGAAGGAGTMTSGGANTGGRSAQSSAGTSASGTGSSTSGAAGMSTGGSNDAGGSSATTVGGSGGHAEGGASTAGGVSVAGGSQQGGASGTSPAGDAGMAGANAGAAGDGAEGGAPSMPPGPNRDWALWPVPNPTSTGLPHPASYDTTSDFVVEDLVTGLDWMRLADTGSRAFSTTACDDLVLGGYDDWRVPSAIELFSLTDWTASIFPYLSEELFPHQPSFGAELWSGTLGYTGAWIVEFEDPAFVNAPLYSKEPTMCVRGGPTEPITHYALTEDLVHDNGTGLTWERNADEDLLAFDDATARCAGLTLGGYDDWRLPGLTELASVLDLSQSTIELDRDVFPDSVVADFRFWSFGSWELDFYGAAVHRNDGGSARARCVR